MNEIIIPEEKVHKVEEHAATIMGQVEFLEIVDQASMEKAQSWLTNIAKAKKQVESFIKELVEPHKKAVKATEAKLKPLLEPYKEADELLRSKCNAYIAKAREEERQRAEKERADREAKEARNKSRMNSLLEIGLKWNGDEERFEFKDLTLYKAELMSDSDEVWEKKLIQLIKEVAAYKKAMKPEEVKQEEAKQEEPLPEMKPEPEPVEKTDLKKQTASGTAFTQKRWTFKEVDLSKVPVEYLQIDSKAVNQAIKDGVREIPGLEIFEEEKIAVRT